MTIPTTPAASPSTDRAAALAIGAVGVSHAYGARQALADVSLDIRAGELFAVLGPNGGGKTTLFRILSTLIRLQRGSISILGHDLAGNAAAIRHLIGVVFQAPSLDRKLTVAENIRLQAALYGLFGRELSRRLEELLDQFALRLPSGGRVDVRRDGERGQIGPAGCESDLQQRGQQILAAG